MSEDIYQTILDNLESNIEKLEKNPRLVIVRHKIRSYEFKGKKEYVENFDFAFECEQILEDCVDVNRLIIKKKEKSNVFSVLPRLPFFAYTQEDLEKFKDLKNPLMMDGRFLSNFLDYVKKTEINSEMNKLIETYKNHYFEKQEYRLVEPFRTDRGKEKLRKIAFYLRRDVYYSEKYKLIEDKDFKKIILNE